MTRSRMFALALLGGGLISLRFGALAIFVAFGCFLFWVTLPALATRERRALLFASLLALALSLVGLARFVVTQAFSGISEAARASASSSVVSRLREIQFAESRAMGLGLVDPDGNGRGSALFLDELAGSRPMRGSQAEPRALLDGKYQRQVATNQGPAAPLNGYLYFVCLPSSGGRLGADPQSAVDERRAEGRFVGFAWPEDEHQGYGQLFAIDEKGNVRVHGNRGEDGKLQFVGAKRPPSCSLLESEASKFAPWRGKASRPR